MLGEIYFNHGELNRVYNVYMPCKFTTELKMEKYKRVGAI